MTDTLTCPAGHPFEVAYVELAVNEGQELSVNQLAGAHGTASSQIAVAWRGGSLTVAP